MALHPLPIPATLLPALLAVLATGGCVLAPALLENRLEVPQLSEAGQQYYHLVNRLKAEDFDIDFTDLRLAWTHTPLYLHSSHREKRALSAAYRAHTSGEYEVCLQKAGEALTFNYTSLVAHNWASHCALAQGRQMTANFHRSLLDNLLYSILASGDGESPETAWQVTGASEISGLLLLLTLRLENLSMDESQVNKARIRVWDYLEQRERIYWADYSIPLDRYRSAGAAYKAATEQPAQ